jgi:hypothetical protein
VANTWTRGLLQVEVAVKEAGRVRDAHPCISYLPHVCPPSLPPSLPPSPDICPGCARTCSCCLSSNESCHVFGGGC